MRRDALKDGGEEKGPGQVLTIPCTDRSIERSIPLEPREPWEAGARLGERNRPWKRGRMSARRVRDKILLVKERPAIEASETTQVSRIEGG